MSTSVVNMGDGTITKKTVENETPLKPQNDEAGKVVSTPLQNSNQARSAAKGKVKSSGMKSIEAEAVTIGLPYLKARESITIENIGKKFSGNWRITKIRHEISNSGYLCHMILVQISAVKATKRANLLRNLLTQTTMAILHQQARAKRKILKLGIWIQENR